MRHETGSCFYQVFMVGQSKTCRGGQSQELTRVGIYCFQFLLLDNAVFNPNHLTQSFHPIQAIIMLYLIQIQYHCIIICSIFIDIKFTCHENHQS